LRRGFLLPVFKPWPFNRINFLFYIWFGLASKYRRKKRGPVFFGAGFLKKSCMFVIITTQVPVKVRHTESELAEILASGDHKQFGIIYDHFSHSLYGIIKKIVNDEELAQDLLQETFVKVWNNASSYSDQKSRLFTWLLNIARNTCIDYLRSKQGKKDKKNHSLEKIVGIENKGVNSPNHEHIGLNKLINNLRPEYRAIIDLIYFEGFTHEEIARNLEIPLGTVKTRSRAAVQSLKKAIE